MSEPYFVSKIKQPKMSVAGETKNGTVIYNLDEDYEYIWTGPDGFKRKIFVKKGYRSDGASVPRFAWSLSGITPDGLIRAAALPHDLLCEYKGNLPEGSYFIFKQGEWIDISHKHWTRPQSDKLFGRIMRDTGVPKKKRRRAFWGVRLYGWVVGW